MIDYFEQVGPQMWKMFNRGKDKKIWFDEMLHQKVSENWQHPLLERYQELIDHLKQLPD